MNECKMSHLKEMCKSKKCCLKCSEKCSLKFDKCFAKHGVKTAERLGLPLKCKFFKK